MRITATERKIKENLNYSKLDPECVNLCRAINEIPGLCTVDSCCGHGKSEYMIFFFVTSFKNLSTLLSCIYANDDWVVRVYAAYFGIWPTFFLEGPTGDFEAAEKLATDIRQVIMEIQHGEWGIRAKKRLNKNGAGQRNTKHKRQHNN